MKLTHLLHYQFYWDKLIPESLEIEQVLQNDCRIQKLTVVICDMLSTCTYFRTFSYVQEELGA